MNNELLHIIYISIVLLGLLVCDSLFSYLTKRKIRKVCSRLYPIIKDSYDDLFENAVNIDDILDKIIKGAENDLNRSGASLDKSS